MISDRPGVTRAIAVAALLFTALKLVLWATARGDLFSRSVASKLWGPLSLVTALLLIMIVSGLWKREGARLPRCLFAVVAVWLTVDLLVAAPYVAAGGHLDGSSYPAIVAPIMVMSSALAPLRALLVAYAYKLSEKTTPWVSGLALLWAWGLVALTVYEHMIAYVETPRMLMFTQNAQLVLDGLFVALVAVVGVVSLLRGSCSPAADGV